MQASQISPIFSKAEKNAKCYTIKKEFHDMYDDNPSFILSIFVRIDSKIIKGHGYQYKYAPVMFEGYIDYANSFWDCFDEMQEMPKTYTESL